MFVQRHWGKGEESCGVWAGGGEDGDESPPFFRASVSHLFSISIPKRET